MIEKILAAERRQTPAYRMGIRIFAPLYLTFMACSFYFLNSQETFNKLEDKDRKKLLDIMGTDKAMIFARPYIISSLRLPQKFVPYELKYRSMFPQKQDGSITLTSFSPTSNAVSVDCEAVNRVSIYLISKNWFFKKLFQGPEFTDGVENFKILPSSSSGSSISIIETNKENRSICVLVSTLPPSWVGDEKRVQISTSVIMPSDTYATNISYACHSFKKINRKRHNQHRPVPYSKMTLMDLKQRDIKETQRADKILEIELNDIAQGPHPKKKKKKGLCPGAPRNTTQFIMSIHGTPDRNKATSPLPPAMDVSDEEGSDSSKKYAYGFSPFVNNYGFADGDDEEDKSDNEYPMEIRDTNDMDSEECKDKNCDHVSNDWVPDSECAPALPLGNDTVSITVNENEDANNDIQKNDANSENSDTKFSEFEMKQKDLIELPKESLVDMVQQLKQQLKEKEKNEP
eukprot:Pgem_evm1s2528